jgi:thiamine biosynthesis lipoprotein
MDKTLEISRSFRCMNTGIEAVLCVADNDRTMAQRALDRVEQWFNEVQRTLSRFEPESELSHLNSAAGVSFKASPLLFKVVNASLEAARMTDGIFDPTILPDLLAAGYDLSFEKIAWPRNLPDPRSSNTGKWRDIRLEADSSLIFLPAGCCLDLGGIGKGWAVDQAYNMLGLFPNYAVDAGGDIRVKGMQADGFPWGVGVADPFTEGRDLTVIEMSRGAICTSSSVHRKWELAGKTQHHIIDPRSGKPSQSDIVSATVVADSAARAEIIAKTLIILGSRKGLQFIQSQPGTQALLVLKDGRLLRSPGFKERQYVAA